MTSPKQVLFNTREQILSSDSTRIGQLAGKAVMDALRDIEIGVEGTTPRNATLFGLEANPGAGLSFDIDPGAIAFFDVSVVDPDASQYVLGRLSVTTNVALAAADPGNPRVDVIHATPTSSDTDNILRNVISLPTRVVTPTLINKTRDPAITLAVATGTPSATPATPAVPAGAIPLWYVFVPAAAAGPLTDSELADARIQFNTSGWSRKHGRLDGMYPFPVGATTNITFRTGTGAMNGAIKDILSEDTFDADDLFASAGGGPVGNDTEYHIYAVLKGSPSYPVAKTLDAVYVVATDTPDEDGRPTGALFSYRPLRGIHDEWVHSTQPQALYIGSALSTSTGVWQIGGDSQSLNKDGKSRQAVFTGTTAGFAGGATGFLRKPQMTWVSATQVRIEEFGPLPVGVPGITTAALTATMPGDLVSGDSETADTWYYVYLRSAIPFSTPAHGGVVRNYTLVISTEAPNARLQKPTPEATFASSDYLFLGSFYNNSGSDIEPFDRTGDIVLWRLGDSDIIVPATNPSFTTHTLKMPATSRIGIISLNCSFTATAAAAVTRLINQFFQGTTSTAIHDSKRTQEHNNYTGAAGGEVWDRHLGQMFIPCNSSGQFRTNVILTNVSSHGLTINQQGYVEDVEHLPQ